MQVSVIVDDRIVDPAKRSSRGSSSTLADQPAPPRPTLRLDPGPAPTSPPMWPSVTAGTLNIQVRILYEQNGVGHQGLDA